ncbi:iron chaperone [Herbiconiux liangxiaofengii]|uniref:iron chaperone n=1 Tax=Herbiconiux liangxiaofengii TaxID=3342795 RepID=UPI0035B7A7A8
MAAASGDKTSGFSAEERAAMKERAAELRAEKSRSKAADKAAAEAQDTLDAIAAMEDDDRVIAERLHAIVLREVPELAPRLWYGMPAYAKAGKVVFFFQAGKKFSTRYATLGFSDPAALDDGAMWPTAYALTAIGDAEEKAIAALVKRAVS